MFYYNTKILLIGDAGIGKTSLVKRYVENRYIEKLPKTVIDFSSKIVELDGEIINSQLWDISGQHNKVESFIPNCFSNLDGVLIIFDLSDNKSLESVRSKWIPLIEANSSFQKIVCVLVGTKADLNPRKVKLLDYQNLANEIGCKYYETSARENKNVNEMFRDITKAIIHEKSNADNLFKLPISSSSNLFHENSDTYKIIIVGDCEVGKTCIMLRYLDDMFNEGYMSSTNNQSIEKEINIEGSTIKLRLVDMPGRNQSVSEYENAHGVILVYDITNQNSFENLEKWYELVNRYSPSASQILLGNKADLASMRAVELSQALSYSKVHGMEFFETSAKASFNIERSFASLCSGILKKKNTKQTKKIAEPLETKVSVEYDALIKLLLIGDSSSGKSSLLQRFAYDSFSINFLPTIGVDFNVKTVDICGKKVKLQIWDTAGQERFRSITSAYYRGAHGAMIVFDLTSKETFDHVPVWIDDINSHASSNIKRILVGNKCDLKSERFASTEEIQNKIANYGVEYIEVSALNSTNVDLIFNTLTKAVILNSLNVGAQ